MGKMIVDLSNNKCQNNNNSTGHINHIQISLLMSIVDTPEKYVSNVDRKLDKRKIRTSLIKSPSKLFLVQYVQFIIEFIVLKINVSCWSHLFLQSIHQFSLRNIMKIYFLKTYQWITCLNWKSPSCNTFHQCKRLSVCQN